MKQQFWAIIIACLFACNISAVAQPSIENINIDSLLQSLERENYHKNIILIKPKKQQNIDKHNNITLGSELSSKLSNMGVDIKNIRSPFAKYYRNADGLLAATERGIERICEIEIERNDNILAICQKLMQDTDIEYAEPMPMRYTCGFTPNDPAFASQWHLSNINAASAWDVVKDKTGVVIGIVDSGVDWEHQDLNANIWINTNEIPDNGIDDDGNGKIDDIHGWDFVGDISDSEAYYSQWKEDNNPTPGETENSHGTHVAGLAAEVTNNATDGAGIGINCKLLPSKHGSDKGTLSIYRGYEGILYVAKLGAKVINCSWGGLGYSYTEEDVINEALSMGATIIAAAGNSSWDNDLIPHYPSSYHGVITVGSIDKYDNVSDFSNYGYAAHIYAPGSEVYSTLPNSKYGSMSGTSMSSPVAAGTAGLVLSVFPEYTWKQVYHQLRSTQVPFIKTPTKDKYKYSGHIDAQGAVVYNNPDFSEYVMPGVSIVKYSLPPFDKFTNNNEVTLTLTLRNYIGKAENLSVSVKSLDGYVSISAPTAFELGAVNISEERNIVLNMRLNSLTAISEGKAKFLVEYRDGDFYDYEVLYIPVSIPANNKTAFYSNYTTSQYAPVSVHFNGNMTYLGASIPIYSGFSLPAYAVLNESTGAISMEYLNFSNVSPDIIYGIDANNVIIGGYDTWLKKACVLANTKKIDLSSLTSFINFLSFFDNTNGLLIGNPVDNVWGIAKTSDMATSWKPVTNIPAAIDGEVGGLNTAIAQYNNNNIWFGTSMGRVFSSADKGDSWKVDTILLGNEIAAIGFKNTDTGMAVYNVQNGDNIDMTIATTIDGGDHWSKNVSTLSGVAAKPKAIYNTGKDNIFYILFDNNMVLASNDMGKNWITVPTKELSGIVGITGVPSAADDIVKVKSVGLSTQNNSNSISNYMYGYTIATTSLHLPIFDITRSITTSPLGSLNYGMLDLGEDSIRTITITNTGTAQIEVKDFSIIPDNDETTDLDFTVMNTASYIAPGKNITIRVKFEPKTAGNKEAILYISNNSDKYPTFMYKLIGEGNYNEFATLQANRTTLQWDELSTGQKEQQGFILTNVGNIDAVIDSIKIIPVAANTKENEFKLINDIEYPLSIKPLQQNSMLVEFSPQTLSDDSKEAKLIIYNSGTDSVYTVKLIGSTDGTGSVIETNHAIFPPVSPNPSNGECLATVALTAEQHFSIDLFDIAGNKLGTIYDGIGTNGANPIHVNVSGISDGTYLLILNIGDKKYLNKLTISR